MINGERAPLANPNFGFLIATHLEPNETIIVLFTVQVINPPVNNEFKTVQMFLYNFKPLLQIHQLS